MGWHSRSVVSSASFSPSLTRAARSSGTLESFEDGVAGLLPPGVPETGVVLGSIIVCWNDARHQQKNRRASSLNQPEPQQ